MEKLAILNSKWRVRIDWDMLETSEVVTGTSDVMGVTTTI